jgi:hypothetical protein
MSRKSKPSFDAGSDFEEPSESAATPPPAVSAESELESVSIASETEGDEPPFARQARARLGDLDRENQTPLLTWAGAVSLDVAVESNPHLYAVRNLNLRLTARQAWALRSLQEGADAARVTLASERRVTNAASAVCYLLEQLAEAIERAA